MKKNNQRKIKKINELSINELKNKIEEFKNKNQTNSLYYKHLMDQYINMKDNYTYINVDNIIYKNGIVNKISGFIKNIKNKVIKENVK